MNVLIIEDESHAAQKLEQMLQEISPDIRVIGKTASITGSVRWLQQHQADLIFLDIQLSDGLSFSIFEQVAVNTPVIFTTAYDQYAIKAFQLNSIAYLLKPIRQADLTESLNKYRSLKSAFSIDFESLLEGMQGIRPDFRKRFLIQIGERIKKVEATEVAYFYVMDKGVYLRTFAGNSYPVEFPLDKLETMMNPGAFFRINRKFLVNIDSISSMRAWSRSRVKLELKPPPEEVDETIVSIDRSPAFKKWLNS